MKKILALVTTGALALSLQVVQAAEKPVEQPADPAKMECCCAKMHEKGAMMQNGMMNGKTDMAAGGMKCGMMKEQGTADAAKTEVDAQTQKPAAMDHSAHTAHQAPAQS